MHRVMYQVSLAHSGMKQMFDMFARRHHIICSSVHSVLRPVVGCKCSAWLVALHAQKHHRNYSRTTDYTTTIRKQPAGHAPISRIVYDKDTLQCKDTSCTCKGHMMWIN